MVSEIPNCAKGLKLRVKRQPADQASALEKKSSRLAQKKSPRIPHLAKTYETPSNYKMVQTTIIRQKEKLYEFGSPLCFAGCNDAACRCDRVIVLLGKTSPLPRWIGRINSDNSRLQNSFLFDSQGLRSRVSAGIITYVMSKTMMTTPTSVLRSSGRLAVACLIWGIKTDTRTKITPVITIAIL